MATHSGDDEWLGTDRLDRLHDGADDDINIGDASAAGSDRDGLIRSNLVFQFGTIQCRHDRGGDILDLA